MSDRGEQNYNGRESRPASRGGSAQRSDIFAASSSRSSSRSHSSSSSSSRSRPRSGYSRSRYRPRYRSRAPSRSSSRRSHIPPRSRSRTRQQSRGRSYSRDHRHYRDHHDYDYHGYRRLYRYSHSLATRRRHMGNRCNPNPNCCLGIFGLNLSTTERHLRQIFYRFGPISEISIVYDRHCGCSRGYAFVYFENVHDAVEAKEHVDGMELHGRRIRVDFSITKRPHSPTPGMYLGRPTYNRCIHYYYPEYDRRYSDWDSYNRSYREGGGLAASGSGGGWRYCQDQFYIYRRRSRSPCCCRRRYRSCSRCGHYSHRF
ncbi:transformer-2 protein homolog beta-like [Trichosurus vulpecula]|uniref:transformer-2 protein homolog beta-like n=1 Tax=Trichosurus vulpecula TaxID=9337 RepID=UPI00186B273B|nr:transformer-2 protein homolog beta-like [Trichosurus vulpecula]